MGEITSTIFYKEEHLSYLDKRAASKSKDSTGKNCPRVISEVLVAITFISPAKGANREIKKLVSLTSLGCTVHRNGHRMRSVGCWTSQ